jgi:anaerobic magnesium-protoporphyrin IX monomethyl ester cyclase
LLSQGAHDSYYSRRVRDLLHAPGPLQQSKALDAPEHYRQASASLDAKWTALVASERAHRSDDATPSTPATKHIDIRLLPHAAAAQAR